MAGVESGRLTRSTPALALLFEQCERLAGILGQGDRLERSDAWQSARRRVRMLDLGGDRPLLIATLYGPTGAGKSTLFRLLTGIPVPAGEVRRPTTRANVVAVPEALAQPEILKELFGFEVAPLDDVDRLRESPAAGHGEVLFYRAMSGSLASARDEAAAVSLALADVPDFDTFARDNWRQAEAMLRQAHLVVYLCYAEGYATEKNLQELARCARLAGELVYVFTKLDRAETAPEFRSVLLHSLDELPEFQERRQDGRTLAEFVAQAPMYASIRTGTLELNAIQPIPPTSRPFGSFLRGEGGLAILEASLQEPLQGVLHEAHQLLDAGQRTQESLAGRVASIDSDTVQASRRIVEGEFPADRLLAIIQDELRTVRWSVLDRITRFMRGPMAGMRALLGRLQTAWRSDPADEIVDRNTYESRARRVETERLVQDWRGRYRAEAQSGQLLSAERIEAVGSALDRTPLPAVTQGWEDVARAGVRQWITEHRAAAWSVANLMALGWMIGGMIVMADVVITGGVVGTLGGIAASGAAGPAGAALLQVLGKLHLQSVAEMACQSWFDERQNVLHRHLRDGLARPLFAPWYDTLGALEKLPKADLQRTLRDLEARGTEIRR